LWLWDSWIVITGPELHLYCLALSRVDHDGAPIPPGNEYFFHIRHFLSLDDGASWTDKGRAIGPGNMADQSDAGNIWSGSVHALEDGRILYGFTGLAAAGPDHNFIQTICFALGSDTSGPDVFPAAAASHPVRDREAIVDAGYYLPAAGDIGHNEGEEGGPILAWRDPHIFQDDDGIMHAFWSAKIAPRIPAVAHAILGVNGDTVSIASLEPPILLPDVDAYTQAEVPKLYKDPATETYYMLIAACNRTHESQPDSAISKETRLYKSRGITGPWETYHPGTSVLDNTDYLFGGSITTINSAESTAQLIAPYTTKIGTDQQLSFEAIRTISFKQALEKTE
jgi:beta-xylosidase